MQYFEYDLKLMKVVKAVRKLKGLKQINLANDLGIDRSHFCRIENGEILVSAGRLKQIAMAMDTTISSLQNIVDLIASDRNMVSKDEIYQDFLKMSEEVKAISFSKEDLMNIIQEAKK